MTSIATASLPSNVTVPTYNRAGLKTKIVHLGFGAFHRAHQAFYTNELAERHQSDWGICEVNLFTGKAPIEQLKTQDYLYSVIEKATDSVMTTVVGVVTGAMHPELDTPQGIIEKMAEPQVAIVSLTVTEKGYCCDPASGQLDTQNALIQHDLMHPETPKSAIGYVVQALILRKSRGLTGFSVLSCDNMQGNGLVAKAAILGFVKQLDGSLSNNSLLDSSLLEGTLSEWIEKNVTFPSTMVDRIVPAMTEENVAEVAHHLTVSDPCAVICEPFRQWVIEDNFIQSRPDWNRVGAIFTQDVETFEEMKLRLLNGSHSFLAYLGYLGGYQYISDTMQDNHYKQAVLNMMLKEQAPTLSLPDGVDVEAYAVQLIQRFSNTELKHKTEQIAMDGSQKLPQRFLNSLRYTMKNSLPYDGLVMGIAGWMHYVSGVDKVGNAIEVKDPMTEVFAKIHKEHKTSASRVHALLGLEAIFGQDLISDDALRNKLTNAYQLIDAQGVRAAVATLSK
ncbi:mannitol dehydrogenase family protein [Marinomonas sp. 2405UD68-3]|uniref:mannitol dehydrogenase family protein n=1 Tax=Marinomonas sp. 2405UD68-3 TaxID=3391835 RepID=UPI0039C9F980